MTKANKPPSRAAGWLTIANLLAGAVNYLYALGLTHDLSRADYPVFAAGQSLLLINGTIGSAGVPWVLAQQLGRHGDDPAKKRDAVTFAFWVNVAEAIVLGAIVLGISLTFGGLVDAAILAGTTAVLAVGSTGLGYLQGVGRTEALAAVLAGETVLKLGAGMLLVTVAGMGATGALLGNLAGAGVLAVTLPMVLRHVGRPKRQADLGGLWKSAFRIGGLQLGVGLISVSDGLLVAAISTTHAMAAPYQAASTLGRVPLFISNGLATAVFPTLHLPGARARRRHALRSYLLVSGFICAALVTVPGPVVNTLFSSQYSEVSTWLPYTAALGVAIGLLNMLTTFHQAEQRSGTAMTYLSVAAGGALVSMVVWAQLDGVRGLAIAASVSAWVACLLVWSVPLNIGRWVVTQTARVPPLPLVPTLACVVAVPVLVVLHEPFAWLAVAAVGGLASLVAAFPELGGKPAQAVTMAPAAPPPRTRGRHR